MFADYGFACTFLVLRPCYGVHMSSPGSRTPAAGRGVRRTTTSQTPRNIASPVSAAAAMSQSSGTTSSTASGTPPSASLAAPASSPGDTATATDHTDVSAVSLKLPPFWAADAEVWFAQAEATFLLRGITREDTKFQYVVGALEPQIAVEVRDLIVHPPTSLPYSTLKQELTSRTSQTEHKRLQQLLTEEDLGDRKPSQFLRRMQQLKGTTNIDDSLLRELFLQRMPSQVRAILATTPTTTSLEATAKMADSILEQFTISTVSAVPDSAPAPSLESQLATLCASVARLDSRMDEFQQQDRGRRPRRSQPSSRSATPERSTAAGICWYHSRFGAKAQRCTTPCSYTSGNAEASH